MQSNYSVSATKRISSDLKEINKYPIEGVAVVPNDDALGVWTVYLEGPRGTHLYVPRMRPFLIFRLLFGSPAARQ